MSEALTSLPSLLPDLAEYSHIRENLSSVRARLAAAAARGGNPTPKLIAVTKSATDDEVRALLLFGVDAIAENRPQLFVARAALADALCEEAVALGRAPTATEIHLIGTLQTNKVRHVVGRAATIQSVDSEKLAAEIERIAAKRELTVPVLIEVNSGREAQKGGLMPEDVPAFAAHLATLPHLCPVGLMTMGPDCETAEEYRPYFKLTRALAGELAAKALLPAAPLLSMGMSGSYEIAAEEGATMVRVGRTLFHKPN